MTISITYNVGITSIPGNNTTSFEYEKDTTDILGFSNAHNAIDGVLINTWAPNFIILDSELTEIVKQSKSTVYVDTTHVKLVNGATGSYTSVELNVTNVLQSDCMLKIVWGDSLIPTTVENAKFFAYDLNTTQTDPPPGIVLVAFEHTGSVIRKNRVGGDAVGKAWNAAYGIGGRANALSLATQSSAMTHTFYIGFSAKPIAYGNSTFAFAVEFDVS